MLHFKHTILLVNLIGCFISSASCISQLRSMRILNQEDLRGTIENFSLPNKSLSLVAEDGDQFYLGGRDAVYELRKSNISRIVKVAAWPSGGGGSGLVRSVYFPGNSRSTAFVCAIVGAGESRACHRFDRGATSGAVWSHSMTAPLNPQISALLLPPAPSKTAPQRPPVSLRLAGSGSRVFFAALPPIREATDLVELTGPAFADIGFTTADLYSRRSRALWMARGARAHVMHESGDRMYTVYTEPAAETSNYADTVNTERSGLVQVPIFTRLARICLNDPGQTVGNKTSPRVLTSFFKLRLICRHEGTDYDVLDLATEVSDGQFVGLFAPQNSPPGGFRALCRFRLADAERLLTGDGDLMELSRPSWQSPWLASRLTRDKFVQRSDVSQPFNCEWTPADAQRNRLSDLLVARMASLLALPMVASALTVLPPEAASGRRPTALTLLSAAEKFGAEEDQLIVGWDTGELMRLSLTANATLSPAVETLQVLPRSQPVKSVLIRNQRIVAFGPNGISALPLTRCGGSDGGGGGGCAACGRLSDPLCVWWTMTDGTGSCVDRASLWRRWSAAEVAAAATATAACAFKNGNSSDLRERGLLLRPPAGPPSPRQLASTGEGGSSQLAHGGASLSSAGIGTGAFFGAIAGASLLAFVVGVALGIGCIAEAAGPCRRGGKPEPRQPISSTSTASTSSSSANRPPAGGAQRARSESSTRNFLLKGIVSSKQSPPLSTSKASDPLMQRQQQQSETSRCQDNEYVQAADLVPIATPATVARGNQGEASRCSSWESCHSDGADGQAETVVEISDPAQTPQPHQQPRVTVNAGIIGRLSLRVGFNGQSS